MKATASLAQIKKFGLKAGDVMITKDSEDPTDIAIPSVVLEEFDEPVLCGYHLALLRPQRDVDGQFLAYALRSRDVNDQFVRGANGSTRFGLTSNVIHNARLPVPPLAEQRKIAAILTSVDEAIQATEAVIAQTRRVKEGLLQELLTKGIGHTRFKQTEIGELPETWEVRRLVEVSAGGIRNGIFKKREEFGDGGVPMINVLDCFTGPPVRLHTLERVLADHGEIDRFEVANGDLLFIRSSLNVEGIGHSAIVQGLTERTVFECHVMRVRPIKEIVPDFLYHYTKSKSFRCRIMGNAQTTTMTTLPQDGLGSLQVPIPPIEEQQQIADTLNSLDRQVREHENAQIGNRQVKTGLLQDLLTGRVRVTP
jgi:type I restriction enzyme S subunit